MPYPQLLLLVVTLVAILPSTYAFGSGDIPDFSFLNDKAYRHGDIENALSELVKYTGSAAAGGGLLRFAASALKKAKGGTKFTSRDVQRTYFGNWCRDMNQAIDIAGLSKLSADTLVLVISILGFMTFGFATEEFEVNAEKLGVYLPVEHLDNPKGYAEKQGDARSYHPNLRGPVDPRELEIDPSTGMKNYLANEGQGWDTSTALIRRTLRKCIDLGRISGGKDGPELFEAYRLLGCGLHSLEDFSAHSNFVELALLKLGYNEVFCHVGDKVIIQTPLGPSFPLVTGTFGSADFLHSLVSGATDKLSQASVTDLSQKLSQASENEEKNVSGLRNILQSLPTGNESDDINAGEDIHAKSKAYHFNPDNVAPPSVQEDMLALLRWRDGVMRSILAKLEMIPGLNELMENLTNALNAYVYTVLAPYVMPILQQAISALDVGSQHVMDSHAEEQFEVFDDPHASDPSHSLLSKDHFNNILNYPAGKIAIIILKHTVSLVVSAWSDDSVDPDETIDQILEAIHHPYFASGQSKIQNEMAAYVQEWLSELSPEDAETTITLLSKENVRNAKNNRLGSEEQEVIEQGYELPAEYHNRSSEQYSHGQHEQSHGCGTQTISQGYSQYAATAGGIGGEYGYTHEEGDDETQEEPPQSDDEQHESGRDDTISEPQSEEEEAAAEENNDDAAYEPQSEDEEEEEIVEEDNIPADDSDNQDEEIHLEEEDEQDNGIDEEDDDDDDDDDYNGSGEDNADDY